MRSIPVELYSEIVQYLDRSDLAAVSVSAKTFHALASPLLYRHIALHETSSIDQILNLLRPLGDRAEDIAPLVQRLELGGTATQRPWRTDRVDVERKTSTLVGLDVSLPQPCAEYIHLAFDDVTIPALLELHLANWFKLDRGFLARHPRLKRLSLGESNGRFRPFLDPIPSGLEYLRISDGKDANMTRLDLGVSSGNNANEILALLQDRYPTLSQVNILGRLSKDVVGDPQAPPIAHVTRAGAVYSRSILHYGADEISVLLVRLVHLFPNLRMLDFIDSGMHGFAYSPASHPDMLRLVQSTDGLQQVEMISFPDGEVYSRIGSGSFEVLATRASSVSSSSILELMGVSKLSSLPQSNWTNVYDYPRILWQDL